MKRGNNCTKGCQWYERRRSDGGNGDNQEEYRVRWIREALVCGFFLDCRGGERRMILQSDARKDGRVTPMLGIASISKIRDAKKSRISKLKKHNYVIAEKMAEKV